MADPDQIGLTVQQRLDVRCAAMMAAATFSQGRVLDLDKVAHRARFLELHMLRGLDDVPVDQPPRKPGRPRKLSEKLVQELVEMAERGAPISNIAFRFAVSRATVYRILAEAEEAKGGGQ